MRYSAEFIVPPPEVTKFLRPAHEIFASEFGATFEGATHRDHRLHVFPFTPVS